MDNYRIVEIIEQEAVFDGEYKLTIDPHLLMKIVNHGSAECADDIEEMENPKPIAVRILIETREI